MTGNQWRKIRDTNQSGINDLKTIPLFPEQKAAIINNCKANIQQLVALSVQNDIDVILTTIFPLGQLPIERSPFWSDEVAVAIADANRFLTSLTSDNITVLNTSEILEDDNGIVRVRYSKDFLHLNAEGYRALNQKLG